MKNIFDFEMRDRACNWDMRTLTSDKKCLFDGKCRRAMILYELHCKVTDKSYYGKTQRYSKKQTMEHIHDVWKVIETGRRKFGENWFGGALQRDLL